MMSFLLNFPLNSFFKVTQLRHELQLKSDLLHQFDDDAATDSESQSGSPR